MRSVVIDLERLSALIGVLGRDGRTVLDPRPGPRP